MRSKPQKRPTNIKLDIEKFNPTIKELPYSFGIISAYIDYKKSNDTWHINTEGNALKLDKEDYKNQYAKSIRNETVIIYSSHHSLCF